MCSAVPPNSGSILRPDNDASSYPEAGEKNLIELSLSVIIFYKIMKISIIGFKELEKKLGLIRFWHKKLFQALS